MTRAANRVYVGDLHFRDVTATKCHEPIVDLDVFQQAQQILQARGEDHSRRAANGSDYQLTGLMRCPKCGKAMLGTRAHGKTKTYRYYTCYSRTRYSTSKCDASRINADHLEPAIMRALADFYRNQHTLITKALAETAAAQAAGHQTQQAELAAVETELTKAESAIERYFVAFENGKIQEELLAQRLEALATKTQQLRTRRDELHQHLAHTPQAPSAATLNEVADHIEDIINNGTENQRKALVEALVATIKIIDSGRVVPIFRVPQPAEPSSVMITG